MLGIFLDTEANGLDWQIHCMIEISFIVVDLKTGEEVASYSSLIRIEEEEWKRSDPVSLSFTGIKWVDLEKGKERALIKKEILEIFKKAGISRKTAIFIGQNPSFDRILLSSLISISEQESLKWPYLWLDLASMFFAKEATHTNIDSLELSKDKIAKFYNLPPEKRPHRALRGVEHLITCYNAVAGHHIQQTT
ncbi:MAG: 3'-5' exonuclease [Chlamydiae bacterium]|nr:3'-5' exonuclease [Chlamydiota bacterium]